MTYAVPPLLVHARRGQTIWITAGVALGFAGGVVCLLAPELGLVAFVCGCIAAPLCGVMLIDLLRRLLTNAPTLTVSHQGVHDQSSVFGAGLVRWEEIARIGTSVGGLGIVLHNPAAFLRRQPLPRRLLLAGLMRVYTNEHLQIPPGLLPDTPADIARQIGAYYDTYVAASDAWDA